MHQHPLKKLFAPSSIAVIGASDRLASVGMKIFKNLLQENFKGKIYAINPKHKKVQGKKCFSSVKEIDTAIDLGVIAAPAKAVLNIIKECGEKGIQTVLVLSSGFSESGSEGKILEDTMLVSAKRYNIRIIGPNCLGVMRPLVKMNATFDNNFALPGSIALVSQSGAINAGILDWAMNKKIGFSAIISLGNSADIGFGDVLDYLAKDPSTKSILLYIEGIKNPLHFMSALKNAARIKPVIVLKAGKNLAGARAALSHTGVLIGSDAVFDTALRCAGAVRVSKIEDLFSAAKILASKKRITGNRLAIITNGGGAGVIATDHAAELNIPLYSLNQRLITQLNEVLPNQWSHQNPIDIIGDATPERYHAVLNICNKNKEIDGILIILVPVSMSDPVKVAKKIISTLKRSDKFIFVCWMGEKQVKTSWNLFEKHHISCFDTPEKAVDAFAYLADYYHNQKLLTQATSVDSDQFKPDIHKAQSIIQSIIAENRFLLTAYESKEIIKLFGIPVIQAIKASTAVEATSAAKLIGFPVVMKINSPDISHKSAIGGVFLNIKTKQEVLEAFKKLMNNIKIKNPHAKILGVTVEKQYPNMLDREIMIGMKRDVVFGPVMSFGAGGTLVEIIEDIQLALPPLNNFLADELISKSRILKKGGKLSSLSKEQIENIKKILLRISNMICALPNIKEMDINPFILHENGMIAVDARIIIEK